MCILPICALSAAEHVKSTRPSTILSTYLLASVVFDIARLRTAWLSSEDRSLALAFSTSFVIQILALLLEAVEKRRFLTPECRGKPREELAGIYSRSMYWWLNHLIRTGYRSALVPESLESLDDDLSARTLDEKFHEAWIQVVGPSPDPLRTDEDAPKYKGRWPLVQTVARVMPSSLLWPIPAKMAVVAFTLCQPLALNRLLVFLQDTESINVGYGLVGAYGLIYIGMAVSTSLVNILINS